MLERVLSCIITYGLTMVSDKNKYVLLFGRAYKLQYSNGVHVRVLNNLLIC